MLAIFKGIHLLEEDFNAEPLQVYDDLKNSLKGEVLDIAGTARKKLQKTIYQTILPQIFRSMNIGGRAKAYHPFEHLLDRWRVYFPIPKDQTRNGLGHWFKNVKKLKGKVPPRVQTACILLGCHAWPTARRKGQKQAVCPLCKD